MWYGRHGGTQTQTTPRKKVERENRGRSSMMTRQGVSMIILQWDVKTNPTIYIRRERKRKRERESLVLLGVWNRNLQYKEKEKKKEGKIDVWERCLREKRNRCIGHLDFSLFIYLFIFFEKPDFSLGWCQRTRRQRKRGLGENFLEFWVGFCCICFV